MLASSSYIRATAAAFFKRSYASRAKKATKPVPTPVVETSSTNAQSTQHTECIPCQWFSTFVYHPWIQTVVSDFKKYPFVSVYVYSVVPVSIYTWFKSKSIFDTSYKPENPSILECGFRGIAWPLLLGWQVLMIQRSVQSPKK